jgi:WD40-like Beta Propeller Repeat
MPDVRLLPPPVFFAAPALLAGAAALVLLAGCGGAGRGPAAAAPLLVSNRGGAVRIYEIAPPDDAARLILSPRADDASYADDLPARLPDGRIAYVSDRDGNPEIYLGSPDGSRVARLTRDPDDPAGAAADLDPSPLGRDAIVFSRTDPGAPAGAPGDLYVAPLDGSVARRLTRDPADDRAPAGSPDGRSIVFVSDRGGRPHLYLIPDLRVADPEATAIDLSQRTTQATTTLFGGRPCADDGPAFLSDGSLIFSRAPEGEPAQIFVMGMGGNGGGVRQVTDARILPFGAAEPVPLGAETLLLTAGPTPAAEGKSTGGRYAVYTISAGGFNLTAVSRRDAPYSDFTRRLAGRRSGLRK